MVPGAWVNRAGDRSQSPETDPSTPFCNKNGVSDQQWGILINNAETTGRSCDQGDHDIQTSNHAQASTPTILGIKCRK